MLKYLKKGAGVTLILLPLLFLGCDDEQLGPQNSGEVTDNAANLIRLKNGIDNLTLNLFSSNLKGFTSGRTQPGIHRFSALINSAKSITNGKTEDWETCAEAAFQQNDDGSVTLWLNYGSGCEEPDGESYQGIIAFKISETDTSGSFQIGFDKFGKINKNLPSKSSTMSGWYAGDWVAHPSDQFLYLEKFVESFEVDHRGENIEKLTASGEFLANAFGLVVTQHNFKGSNNTGNSYKGLVVEPLRFNYTCDSTVIYTRGAEVYEVNGILATIDFGDGSCENTLTLQIDGVTTSVEI